VAVQSPNQNETVPQPVSTARSALFLFPSPTVCSELAFSLSKAITTHAIRWRNYVVRNLLLLDVEGGD